MCAQDYKSRAAVIFFAILVNTQTDRHTHRQTVFEQLIWIAQPTELKTGPQAANVRRGEVLIIIIAPWC